MGGEDVMNKVVLLKALREENKKFSDIKSAITKPELMIGISECLNKNYICFSYNDVLNKSYNVFDIIFTDVDIAVSAS